MITLRPNVNGPAVFRRYSGKMAGHRQALRDSRFNREPGAYVLIVRGPDGRPRFERFDDAAAYKARLMALQQSTVGSVSIEEIVGLLDA